MAKLISLTPQEVLTLLLALRTYAHDGYMGDPPLPRDQNLYFALEQKLEDARRRSSKPLPHNKDHPQK